MKLETIRARLSELEREKQRLEQRLADEERRRLTLPKQVGFQSMDDLVKALIPLTTPPIKAKLESAMERRRSSPQGANDSGGRRQFSKAELATGRKSVAQLSREFGPSHPTIMGWKREWGLTRPSRPARSQ
jgi:hypothetical protein